MVDLLPTQTMSARIAMKINLVVRCITLIVTLFLSSHCLAETIWIDVRSDLEHKIESIDGDLIIIAKNGLDKTILKKNSGEILFYKKKFKGLLFWNKRVAYIEDNGDLFVWVNNEFRKVKGVIPKGTLHFHSFGKEDLGFLDNEVVSLYTVDTVNLNLTFVTKFDVNNKNRWDVCIVSDI